MFGYGSPAPEPALKDVVFNAVKAARAELKSEVKIQSIPDSQVSTKQFESRTLPKTEKPSPPLPDLHSLPTQPIAQKLVGKEKPAARNPTRQEKAKFPKPSISSLDDIMDLLEKESFVPSQPRKLSQTDKEKEQARSPAEKGARKKVKAEKPSISSLDEMMSLLEQDWGIGSSATKDLVTSPNISQTVDEQVSSGLRGITGGNKYGFGGTQPFGYVEEPEEMDVDEVASTSAYRQDSLESSSSFAPSEPRSFVDSLEDSQPQVGEEGNEPTGKPIFDYMKEAEEMRSERKRMEFDRQRFLEENLAFQREADRFAEEEEQMRRFVENLKQEEKADFENQERKRRIAEAKQREEEEKRKRAQDLEVERVAIEMAERLNAENERIENERRARKRAYQERVDMERAKYVEEESKLREQRMEDGRNDREEERRRRSALDTKRKKLDWRLSVQRRKKLLGEKDELRRRELRRRELRRRELSVRGMHWRKQNVSRSPEGNDGLLSKKPNV